MRVTSVVLALGGLALLAIPASATPASVVSGVPIPPAGEQLPPPPTPPPLALPPPPPAAPSVPPLPAGTTAQAALPPAPAEAEPDEGERTSYRKYTLAIDGIGISMLVTGRLLGGADGKVLGQAVAAIGLIGATFGVPALHGGRGHPERAARSMGMRLAAGGLGMLIQSRFTDCASFRLCLDPSGPGAVIGAITASAVDALFMTDERKPAHVLTPIAAATRGGAVFGVATSW